MKDRKKSILAILLMLFAVFPISADPVLTLNTDASSYKVGDSVTVLLSVSENDGLHSVFFDLEYDGALLQLEDVQHGLLASTEDDAELLYAESAGRDRLVASYTLIGAGRETEVTGVLLSAVFRVVGPGNPGETHNFTFNEAAAYDGDGNELGSTSFISQSSFSIDTSLPGAYLSIAGPRDNAVFYGDAADLQLLFTESENLEVTVSNTELPDFLSEPLTAEAGAGVISGVPLTYGFNRLQARLIDTVTDLPVASDSVVVYRSGDDRFVKIIDPEDHQMVNTDLLLVEVESTLGSVTVNGVDAEPTEEDGVYLARVWLHKGFNRIQARTEGPAGERYVDEISVYYQRDDSVFRLLTPFSGSDFKPEESLLVRGEISSLQSDSGLANSVTVDVLYHPDNSIYPSRALIRGERAEITVNDFSDGDIQAPYQFTIDPVSLAGLDSGELEIIAYKNKQGSFHENEIHRIVRVDNSRLWIDLLQPNVFSEDVLDHSFKLENFKGGTDPVFTDMQLKEDGNFSLSEEGLLNFEDETFLSGKDVADLIETKDGSLIALVNESNAMRIYRKPLSGSGWQQLVIRDDMRGYALCETDIGLMVGVSNLFTNNATGLYLVEGSVLKNITLSEPSDPNISMPIPHVQFIESRGNMVYLYGNGYSHLYSFGVFSLIEETSGSVTRLRASLTDKTPFSTDFFLSQFILSEDARTAVLRDKDNNVRFYQLDNGVFHRELLDEDLLEDPYTRVVAGEYSDTPYRCYLLLNHETEALTAVMEHRETGRLLVNRVNDIYDTPAGERLENYRFEGDLLGAAFADDQYHLLFRNADDSVELRSGQILFHRAYLTPSALDSSVALPQTLSPAMICAAGEQLILGYGESEDLNVPQVYQAYRQYRPSGSIRFNYDNPDCDGISGFSFRTDPYWLADGEDGVHFAFSLQNRTGGTDIFQSTGFDASGMTLKEFIEEENPYYTVSTEFDADTDSTVVYVDFNNLMENSRLTFRMNMVRFGNIAPEVGELTVRKKVPVRIPRNPGESIVIPIQGRIMDPTVEYVKIGLNEEPLERNGSFSVSYPIESTLNNHTIELSCRNSVGESVSLSFNVQIFDSVASLAEVEIRNEDNEILSATDGVFTTNQENLTLSGDIMGLEGVMAGYELYGFYFEGSEEKEELLESGIFTVDFDTVFDETYNSLITNADGDISTGYVSGSFSGQTVPLFPGRQKLVVFVENPGGYREEYVIGETPPEVVYNLPEVDQEIRLTNMDIVEIVDGAPVVNLIKYDRTLDLTVFESESSPYQFSRTYRVRGEIFSLYNVDEIRLLSDNDDVVFANGATSMNVEVDEFNRFFADITINMPEIGETGTYNIAFMPTAPFLSGMSRGLTIHTKKSFKGTHVIPDFETRMGIDQWSEEEINTRSKTLRVIVDRYIPDGTRLNLLVNFENTISGTLVQVNPGETVYRVVDEGLDQLLDELKPGRNRIQWYLRYQGETISSSTSGKQDMYDFILDIPESETNSQTRFDFPVQFETYYDNVEDGVNDLPELTVTKDNYAYVEIYLNNQLIRQLGTGTTSYSEDFSAVPLLEGLNRVVCYYEENDSFSGMQEFRFLYDSALPEIELASYSYDESDTFLTGLSVIVTEANLDKVTLLDFEGNPVNSDCDIDYLGENRYRVDWWNLYNDGVNYIRPTSDRPITIEAEDHSANPASLLLFYGRDGFQPDLFTVSFPSESMASRYYVLENGTVPYFQHHRGGLYQTNDIDDLFAGMLKVYNDSIAIRDLSVDAAITSALDHINENRMILQRPDDIVLGSLDESDPSVVVQANQDLQIRTNGTIGFRPGFAVTQTGTLAVSTDINDGVIPSSAAEDYVFTRNPLTDNVDHALSMAFWLRPEDRPYYDSDDQYRTVMVLNDSLELYEDETIQIRQLLYLAVKDEDPGEPGGECLYLLWDRQDILGEPDPDQSFDEPVVLLGQGGTLPLKSASDDNWNLIIIGVEQIAPDFGFIHLSVNDNKEVSWSDEIEHDYDNPGFTERILAEGNSFRFGSPSMEYSGGQIEEPGLWLPESDPDSYGHFSIAEFFYCNRIINFDDHFDIVAGITTPDHDGDAHALETYGNGPGRFYSFNSDTDNISASPRDLRILTDDQGLLVDYADAATPMNWRETDENLDYAETDRGVLRATSGHRNYVNVTVGNTLKFHDVDTHFAENLEAVEAQQVGSDFYTVIDNEDGVTGRYRFCENAYERHGLTRKNQRDWYSVYGEVYRDPTMSHETVAPLDAVLVISINHQVERFPLHEGRFHFVFENNTGRAPTYVDMYIETNERIAVSNDMVFTEGNYRLPEWENHHSVDIPCSKATTRFDFVNEGTVRFWYNPLNADENGYVKYQNILFDSDYIAVYTNMNSSGNAVLCATLQTPLRGAVQLISTAPLREGWQYIELTYSVPGGAAYLRLNGDIIAHYEGDDLPPPITLANTGLIVVEEYKSNGEDNVAIGGNATLRGSTTALSQFADGYFDDIQLSNVFTNSNYEDHQPLVFTVLDNPMDLQIDSDISFDDADLAYYLRRRNGNDPEIHFTDSVSSIPLNLVDLDPGAYALSVTGTLDGLNYRKNIAFVKDDYPLFRLEETTPLVIAEVPSEIKVGFTYDNSFLQDRRDSEYAAVAVRVEGNRDGVPFAETKIIVENYTSFDPAAPRWLVVSDQGENTLDVDGNLLEAAFTNIVASTELTVTARPFYYRLGSGALLPGNFDSYPQNELSPVTIPTAGLNPPEIVEAFGKEYKLLISVGTGDASPELFEQFSIGYNISNSETGYAASGTKPLNPTGSAELYYDDILPGAAGEYDCLISLRYNGETFDTEDIVLTWVNMAEDEGVVSEKKLDIVDFSVINVNFDEDSCKVMLELDYNMVEDIQYQYQVNSQRTGLNSPLSAWENLSQFEPIHILDIDGLEDGDSTVQIWIQEQYTVTISEDPPVQEVRYGMLRTAETTVRNSVTAPEIVLTNTVPSLIPYDNVRFSWTGYHNGEYNSAIKYSYNFDNQGWTQESPEWRDVEFYNLREGYHNFKVKALYNGEESSIASATFYVDVNRPVFHENLITVEENYDTSGLITTVTVRGAPGAVEDASLTGLTLNGLAVELGDDGDFIASQIPVTNDGKNSYVLTAFDKVGNFTDYAFDVENPLTQILFPVNDSKIRFAPTTLVGQIYGDISTDLEIYLFDPTCEENTGFGSWKRAVINSDRTFFIEDVYIHPGTLEREASTELRLAVVSSTGNVYYRDIVIKANNITMPIDMTISSHALEGGVEETEVTIDCLARVDDISSWSIDFDGDGIYDDVRVADDSATAAVQTWLHSYSSVGLVKPRVRVITRSGQYFSVSDELIIHEKIKDTSHVKITDPRALSSVRLEDGSDRIFVLSGGGSGKITVYEVGRNANFISEKLYEIQLNGYGIENPVAVQALDEDHLIIASNQGGKGYVHTLMTNEFDNWDSVTDSLISLSRQVRSIDVDQNNLYLTLEDSSEIVSVDLVGGLPQPDTLRQNILDFPFDVAPGQRLWVSRDTEGLLLADYFNTRIIRLTGNLDIIDYFGSFGAGESQFFKPSIVCSRENRIFVYDETRRDIQVFGPRYGLVTSLEYDEQAGIENYFEEGFLEGICGMTMITRQENGRMYYYALLLSESTGKLAMLRLPQWEELRASVRNNRLVFLNDREAFMAKPSGADLAKVLSTDALPRVEGTLDYPALSPDGRRLVFTSRTTLYGGSGSGNASGNEYAHDNLYMINVDGTDLQRIPLGVVNNYEIERPVFNSNGTKIIFSAKSPDSIWQIYIYDIENGSIQRLFESDGNARFPYYSPDDRFVVFTTDNDGDEDIQIVDTQQTDIRVDVTDNNVRDSYPVWSTVYPYEISNQDLDIESKIAFVSERGFGKSLWYLYIARPSESDIRVVTVNGEDIGNAPDSAAIRLIPEGTEGDYPCFTGDGTAVLYEYFDGTVHSLQRRDFVNPDNDGAVALPDGSRKPAGMKNAISNFTVQAVNGDAVRLDWTRYTDRDIFYKVQYRVNTEGSDFVQKRVFTQDGTVIQGLDMGVEYLFRVCIVENGVEAASSQWKKILMPEVAARPSYEIDPDNPYLVNLHAWKPNDETEWNFTWIIDNQEYPAQTSQDTSYQFATSGTKTIVLKASNRSNTYTTYSQAISVKIVSDIQPVIEYIIGDNGAYIDLDATNSLGENIDWSSVQWEVSGSGSLQNYHSSQIKDSIPLDAFKHKINVTLKLSRQPVNNQVATDTLITTMVIDLDFQDVKPVITYDNEERLFTFSGINSLGNIDWHNAQWKIFADGQIIHQEHGVSSFAYLFAETAAETRYSVSLTVPRINDGLTETSTVNVSVEAAPIEPVIDYEILALEEGGEVVGAKILFSSSNSRGSNIDFSLARWNIPVAGTYGESPTQIGPTAVYNLFNLDGRSTVDVSLTLTKRGGSEAVTETQTIMIRQDSRMKTEINVNVEDEPSDRGRTIILDILDSSGPNIDWEKTQWLVDGQYPHTGPVCRVDVPASGEQKILRYTVTLYRHGEEPVIKTGTIDIEKREIRPDIYAECLDEEKNLYRFHVLNTEGVNIDWSRTTWYFYDGNENVVKKADEGSDLTYAFVHKNDSMGYPVVVEMYYIGDSRPFTAMQTVLIGADVLEPIIYWDQRSPDEPNVIHFSAEDSLGANIDWSSCKWTFGDGSETQYGGTAVHEYPLNGSKATYTASVTIYRRGRDGEQEMDVAYIDVEIGSDVLEPVIHAEVNGDGHLILSCNESRGRGLMLDRSVWLFEGVGDSVSTSSSDTYGKTSSNSFSYSLGVDATTPSIGPVTTIVKQNWNWSNSRQESESSSESESLSSSNHHTGAVCRRYVGDQSSIRATLFVYRMDGNGAIVGEYITANIDLRAAAERGGVSYE